MILPDIESNRPTFLVGLAKYLLTGGSAAVVDLALFAGLHAIGTPILPAAAFSFIVAAIENYIVTSWFVFGRRINISKGLSFFLAAVIGFSVNVMITYISIQFWGLPAVAAKVSGIGAAFLLNFMLSYAVVFRDRRQSKGA